MEHEIHPMPRIGDAAPSFKAVTTQGTIDFPIEYSGKWIILFSHPAVFTAVCTSEFISFARMQEQFDRLNCQLVGLSVEGLSSHIAWLRAIREKINWKSTRGVEVKFPLIDDISMHVANLYGMIHPGASDTKAVRAVFFIDPKGIIRTIIYYPQSVGRNFDEIARVLIALQTSDNFNVALPANWRPGDDVIDPNPSTMDKIAERYDKAKSGESNIKCYDWFFCTKKLSKEEVEKKLGK
jgi:peroxiredoxin (alkyl hydroperoxide reductase subunit C)